MVRVIGLMMIMLGGLGLGMSLIDWQPKDGDWQSTDGSQTVDQHASETASEETVADRQATDAINRDNAGDAAGEDRGAADQPAALADRQDGDGSDDAVVAATPAAGQPEPSVDAAVVPTTEERSPAHVKVFEREARAEDAAPTLWAEIAAASEIVSEDSGHANFLVTLSEPAERSVVIIFSTVDLSANDNEDYRSQRGTVTFQPGVVSAEIRTPLIDDDIKEDDEQFAIVLNGAPGIVNFKSRRVTTTIKDDD